MILFSGTVEMAEPLVAVRSQPLEEGDDGPRLRRLRHQCQLGRE